MKGLHIMVMAATIAAPSASALAQTRDGMIHRLRRAGEQPPRIAGTEDSPGTEDSDEPTEAQQLRDAQQSTEVQQSRDAERSRLFNSRVLGDRIESASQVYGIGNRNTPEGRSNTRILGRLETRLSTRIEGSAAAGSADEQVYGRGQELTVGTSPR